MPADPLKVNEFKEPFPQKRNKNSGCDDTNLKIAILI